MNTNAKISACIIAYNAEHTITGCLDSIKEYCSEIIIALDTKTTDDTYNVVTDWYIKNNINVGIYSYEWLTDSFADARNFAGSKATGDWILDIDCDERLINPEPVNNAVDAYLIAVRNYKDEKHISDYWTPRLYKNNIGIHYRFDTDEENWHCIRGKKYAYSNMVFEHREKSINAVKLKSKWLLERNMKSLPNEPHNPYLRGQISHRHLILGDMLKTIFYGTEAMAGSAEPEVKALQAMHLYRAYRQLRDAADNDADKAEYWDHAIYWLKASVALCPQQLSANALFYQLYKEDGNIDGAEYHKQLALECGNNSRLPYDVLLENIDLN